MKNLTADFMTLPGAGVAKPERFQGGLYAAVPGGGPLGERCNTCKHFVRRSWDKTYLKCDLVRAWWTKGAGSDVRAKSPACSKWEAP